MMNKRMISHVSRLHSIAGASEHRRRCVEPRRIESMGHSALAVGFLLHESCRRVKATVKLYTRIFMYIQTIGGHVI